MANFMLAKWIRPPLEEVAARSAALGISSLILIVAGLGAGFVALLSIARGFFWVGAAFILLSRLFAAIGQVNATEREFGLAAAFDLIFLAGVPFAFALNDPGAGLSATLLLFGLIAAGAASFFANVRRALAARDIAVCVAAYSLACLRPHWFVLIAYVLGLFCFVTAGMRMAVAFVRGDV
jgi:hypothetical protein